MDIRRLKQFLFICFLSVSCLHLEAQRQCGTMPLLEKRYRLNPALRAMVANRETQLREFVKQCLQNRSALRVGATTIRIPIVFHIVMQDPSVVTDAQVLAQLDTINRDYAGLNGDSLRIPSFFKPLFGKSEIQFCLAQRTPGDEPSNGIERTITPKTTFSNTDNEAVKHVATGGADAWDADRYLNVWICDMSDQLLGYGTFPDIGPLTEQGVVIDFACIPGGSITGYNGGKTLTHEIGHYFNLYHIWGDDNGACSGTDYVDDTPNQANSTSGCPTGGVQTDACSLTPPGYMYENFMDYSGDKCLVMFTNLQVARMEAAINLSRPSLLTSNGCVPVNLQNLDAQPRFVNTPSARLCDPAFTPSVSISNKGSNTLTSLTISATIDNGTPTITNWTGSIASLASGIVTLNGMTSPEGNHTLTIITSHPNGSNDQNTANDTLLYAIQYYPPFPLPLSESFEGNVFPPPGWDIVNPDALSTWQRVTPYAKTGTHSVYKNNYSDPFVNQRDYLRLPIVNISNVDSAFISFQVAASVQSNPEEAGVLWDTLQVMVSTDCGKTYTSVYKKWGKDLITTGGNTVAPFAPGADQWRKDSVDISAFIAQGDIMLAFVNTAELENNIFIDDVNVRTTIVNPNLKAKGYLVTPNPTSGQVTLQFYPQPADLKGIVIFSSVGQKVAETVITSGQANNYYTYDLSRNAPGVYIVRAFFNDRTITKKIVLVR